MAGRLDDLDRARSVRDGGERPPPPGPHTAVPWLLGGAVTTVLLLYSSRYGYHRDELYFLIAGRHLDWGYVDQGPLVPLLARLADTVAPDSLTALRTPSALISGCCVVVVAAICRQLGGGRAAQAFSAFLAALSGIVLAAGHLLTTTTPDLLLWLLAVLFTIRMLRTGDSRWAPGVGTALGVGLLNKLLPALLGIGLVAGVAIAGPRRLLRDRWVLLGAGIAVLLAAPNLIWQAAHGFPQLAVAGSIASGDSSYSGRGVAVALQFVIISPYATPVWIAGLVALLRWPEWRAYRAVAWAWPVVFGIVLLTGGKGYYDAPLLLALTAPGAVATARWWSRGHPALRKAILAAGGVLTVAASAVLLLPSLPPDRLPAAVVAVNYDAGETIGWPAFTDSLAAVYHALPPGTRAGAVILAGNYGEAGAVARYGPARGLPPAYSGHNSMVDYGPPPATADTVVAVGWHRPDQLRTWFARVTLAGHVDERTPVDNEENGGPIYLCQGLLRPWPQIWRTQVAHRS